MKKFNKIVTGFALGVLVLLTIAAAIDYRALNTNQFSNVSTVSIIPSAPLTNSLLYSGTDLVVNINGTALLSGAVGSRRSLVWNQRLLFDALDVQAMDYDNRTFSGSSWIFLSITNHNDVSAAPFTSGDVLTYNGSRWVSTTPASTLRTNTILNVTISGGGSVILPGTVQGMPSAGDAYTISGWSLSGMGTSPQAVIDVWNIAPGGTALPTVANSIMGTKPALVTGNVIVSSTITGWSTAIAKGSTWAVNVDSCSGASNLVFQIYGYR